MPARKGACRRSRSPAVAELQRTARIWAASTSALSGAPRPMLCQLLSSRHCGLISASHKTSKRSPWASSEMEERLIERRSEPSGPTASTSHRRPRVSTKLPTWGIPWEPSKTGAGEGSEVLYTTSSRPKRTIYRPDCYTNRRNGPFAYDHILDRLGDLRNHRPVVYDLRVLLAVRVCGGGISQAR
jgi:hypothetical protein